MNVDFSICTKVILYEASFGIFAALTAVKIRPPCERRCFLWFLRNFFIGSEQDDCFLSNGIITLAAILVIGVDEKIGFKQSTISEAISTKSA